MSTESTEFLEKNYPLLKAILDYLFKRIELIIVTLVITGGVGYFEHKHGDKEVSLQKQIQQTSQTVTNVVDYITK